MNTLYVSQHRVQVNRGRTGKRGQRTVEGRLSEFETVSEAADPHNESFPWYSLLARPFLAGVPVL